MENAAARCEMGGCEKIGAGAWTMGRQLRKVVCCPDRWLKAVVGRIAENHGKGEHT